MKESITATGCTFRSAPGLLVQILALTPDLFRLRIARGRKLSDKCPWAVVQTDWEPHPVAVSVKDGVSEIQTSKGRLQFSTRDNAWQLSDSTGLQVFVSPARGTVCRADSAQVDLELAARESIFGLGESTGQFNKRGLVRDFWNIDVLGHAPAIHPGLKNLYVSIPFLVSLRNGRAAGLFWDDPRRQSWDLGQANEERARLTCAAGAIDLYLFLGPTPAEVVGRYTDLTGRIPMPPRWALGYQQCRYSYASRRELEEVARQFRQRQIPCDVVYLDIHHMDGYRVFTFGKSYPKPAEMIRKLARQGFKVVTIVDPGVKDDPKFGVLRRGREARAFVKAADGKKDLVGEVWPGAARFPDFLNGRCRRWWGAEQSALQAAGVAGFWNDMNEPANFARPDKTLPPDARHETDAGPARHEEVHNLYGMQMSRASREGALTHRADKRPFVVTRASYAGGQRYSVIWTGDNSSCWEHLTDAIQMLLNLGLSGVAFCGGDVGGFLDNTTGELLTRWMQFAAFTPFFRNHSNLGTKAQEPWAFGPAVEETCRMWIGIRYQFLPYWYLLFAEARRTGAPPMRPLLWHYPNDPVAVACGDQFLLGRDVLVAPVTRQGASARSVYLPNEVWYDFWTGEPQEGGRHVVAAAPPDRIPVFVRAGAMIPLTETRQHLDGAGDETITLHVWPGPRSTLEWYEDDGTSMAHEHGEWVARTLTQSTAGHTLRVDFSAENGQYRSAVKVWRLLVWGVRRPVMPEVDGQPVPCSHADDAAAMIVEVPNTPKAFQFIFKGV